MLQMTDDPKIMCLGPFFLSFFFQPEVKYAASPLLKHPHVKFLIDCSSKIQ